MSAPGLLVLTPHYWCYRYQAVLVSQRAWLYWELQVGPWAFTEKSEILHQILLVIPHSLPELYLEISATFTS